MRHYLGTFRIRTQTDQKQDVFEVQASCFTQARRKAEHEVKRNYVAGTRIVGCEFAGLAGRKRNELA